MQHAQTNYGPAVIKQKAKPLKKIYNSCSLGTVSLSFNALVNYILEENKVMEQIFGCLFRQSHGHQFHSVTFKLDSAEPEEQCCPHLVCSCDSWLSCLLFFSIKHNKLRDSKLFISYV